MLRLQIKEAFVDETKGHIFSETDWYEPYTMTLGEVFKDCQKAWGKCTSRIYRDEYCGDGTVRPYQCGWHFQKNVEYEDSPKKYLRGVWVTYRWV